MSGIDAGQVNRAGRCCLGILVLVIDGSFLLIDRRLEQSGVIRIGSTDILDFLLEIVEFVLAFVLV